MLCSCSWRTDGPVIVAIQNLPTTTTGTTATTRATMTTTTMPWWRRRSFDLFSKNRSRRRDKFRPKIVKNPNYTRDFLAVWRFSVKVKTGNPIECRCPCNGQCHHDHNLDSERAPTCPQTVAQQSCQWCKDEHIFFLGVQKMPNANLIFGNCLRLVSCIS